MIKKVSLLRDLNRLSLSLCECLYDFDVRVLVRVLLCSDLSLIFLMMPWPSHFDYLKNE